MQITLFFALLIAILAVIFAVQNADTTTVRLAFWESQQSLALIILLSTTFGVLISFLVSSPSLVKNKLTIRNQRKRIAELEASLAEQKAKLDALQPPPPALPADALPAPTPEEKPVLKVTPR